MIEKLRRLTDATVRAVVYSHGHAGYNAGLPLWLEHAAKRNEAPPQLIAHRGVVSRYQRYLETAGLQAWLNSRQFRKTMEPFGKAAFPSPTITFDQLLRLEDHERPIELLAAPSETDDTLAVWLPNERFLFGSAAMIRSIPNIGTPLRTFRDPVRWADTLERLQALRPSVVLPEFGAPITDADEIEDAFRLPIRGLRWLRAEVVRLMNLGLNEREILAAIEYPEEIFSHPFMAATYGAPEFIVRDIWRSENGWWDRNPTHLHPAKRADAAAAVLSALGDPAAVLANARQLAEDGQIQLAMHVTDLLVGAPSEESVVLEARVLKAELCRQRAQEVSSVVSRQILLSSAEDLLGLPVGSTRAHDPPPGLFHD